MRFASIWDLDGTLFDCTHRLHLILQKEPDWDAFHERTLADGVYYGAMMTFKALVEGRFTPLIFTSRPEVNRKLTERQLELARLRVPSRNVYMRGEGDYRPSVDVKRDMLLTARSRGFTPIMAFEDQPSVVEMYRKQGVTCWAADDREWRRGKYREASVPGACK